MSYSSQALREQARKALHLQSHRTVTVLSSLLAVQDELGYVPTEAIEEVASFTDSTINDVWGVASFYTNFRFAAPGLHNLEVCWGPTCHLLGAPRILQEAQHSLGLSGEGETEDKRFTLRYNTCLGACSQGPVINIDHRLIGQVTVERIRRILTELNGSPRS
ncbi:MAG: NAD(P)H-dependent oxidoreductase subunit E [Chloroflexi bacterium]|nr:NAD(P)H-dependent oxidoreductase subunit E [Chloroflexota bacterium]